jgi:hypothetical protein
VINRVKRVRIHFLSLLALIVALTSLPLYSAAAAGGPKIVRADIYSPDLISIAYDQPIAATGDNSTISGAQLAKFSFGDPSLKAVYGSVAQNRLFMTLNKAVSRDNHYIDMDVEAGAVTNVTGLASESVDDFRVTTLQGRLALQQELDPNGTGITLDRVAKRSKAPGVTNLIGAPGIDKEDIRFALSLMDTSIYIYALQSMVPYAESKLPLAAEWKVPADVVQALQTEINEAKALLNDPAKTQRQLDAAYLDLYYAHLLIVQGPQAWGTSGSVQKGQPITAGSTQDGKVYLVPASKAISSVADLEQQKVLSAAVTSGVSVTLSSSSLTVGESYKLYAVSLDNRISVPFYVITITAAAPPLLVSNGTIPTLRVGVMDGQPYVYVPKGLTVGELLAGLSSNYDLKVKNGNADVSASTMVTGEMAVALGTTTVTYDVRMSATVSTWGELVTALLSASNEGIVVQGSIVNATTELVIPRHVWFITGSSDAVIEAKRFKTSIYPAQDASLKLISNASTDVELRQELLSGTPTHIRLTGVDSFGGGLLARKFVDGKPPYFANQAAAYVADSNQLLTAWNAGETKIYLADSITADTLSLDSGPSALVASSPVLLRVNNASGTWSGNLTNVTIVLPVLKELIDHPDVEIFQGTTAADTYIYVPYGMTTQELFNKLESEYPFSINYASDGYGSTVTPSHSVYVEKSMSIRVEAPEPIIFDIRTQLAVGSMSGLQGALGQIYNLEAIKILGNIADTEVDLSVDNAILFRTVGDFTIGVRSIQSDMEFHWDPRLTFIGHADNDNELVHALNSPALSKIIVNGLGSFSGTAARGLETNYFTIGNRAYVSDAWALEEALAAETITEIYMARDIIVEGELTFNPGLSITASAPRKLAADGFTGSPTLTNVTLVQHPFVVRPAYMTAPEVPVTELPWIGSDIAMELVFSRMLTEDERDFVEDAFRINVSQIPAESLDFDWYMKDGMQYLNVRNEYPGKAIFEPLITVKLSTDPDAPEYILLDGSPLNAEVVEPSGSSLTTVKVQFGEALGSDTLNRSNPEEVIEILLIGTEYIEADDIASIGWENQFSDSPTMVINLKTAIDYTAGTNIVIHFRLPEWDGEWPVVSASGKPLIPPTVSLSSEPSVIQLASRTDDESPSNLPPDKSMMIVFSMELGPIGRANVEQSVTDAVYAGDGPGPLYFNWFEDGVQIVRITNDSASTLDFTADVYAQLGEEAGSPSVKILDPTPFIATIEYPSAGNISQLLVTFNQDLHDDTLTLNLPSQLIRKVKIDDLQVVPTGINWGEDSEGNPTLVITFAETVFTDQDVFIVFTAGRVRNATDEDTVSYARPPLFL